LIDEAKKMGIERIEVAHPTHPINKMTVAEQKMVAEKGAYVGLYCWGLGNLPFHQPEVPAFNWDQTLRVIKEVGPEHLVMATDTGHFALVKPVEAIRAFIAALLAVGVSDNAIERMVKTNPRDLLY
jgi:sugar phosphate isomerase/epimerase